MSSDTAPSEAGEDIATDRVRLSLATAPGWFLGLPPWVQFLCWLVVILAVKHGTLFEPPVWDSAMGIFPPAIYLYENHFDIRGLLQQSNWIEGGPNVHSLSMLAWVIAAAMKLTNSPQATFAIIHLLTFAAFAWTLQLFTRVLQSYHLAPRTVLAAGCYLLLMPLVLVQVGAMYTESLVMCTGVAAWAFWQQHRPGLAVLLCVAGIFLKLTAVPVAMLVFAALLFSGRPYHVRKILFILVIPVALWVNRSLGGWLGAIAQPVMDWGSPEQLMFSFKDRMRGMPDVRWLIRFGLLSGVAYLVARVWKDRGIGVVTRSDPDSRSRLICLAMPFVFMVGVLAMVHTNNLFLNRYLLPVFPFAIGATLLFASRVRGEMVAFVVLIGACLYSAANHNGRFYAPAYASFSIVEQSHAYRDFHAVQIKAIQALVEKPDEVPAFVSREVDYMISHRMMGYVGKPVPNTWPIYVSPHKDRSLDEFPGEFILLRSNNGHGGSKMGSLVRNANASDDHTVTERLIEQAGFRATVYTVRREREASAPR